MDGNVNAASTLTFQSTHPVKGATKDLEAVLAGLIEFQSTHPVKGATT